MPEIALEHLSLSAFLMIAVASFMVGLAKAGVQGTTLFAVPLLALAFGGISSSGLMLPMMIMADIFAVIYYHRHANWHFLVKLFPSAGLGVILGTWIGEQVDDAVFRQLMAVIIFASLGLMLWFEKGNKEHVPDYAWFAIFIGVLGGITTMIGNLAGSVMAVYLLAMRLPKQEFIGTTAWFFLVVNLFKVPFHVFVWHSISVDSFWVNLSTLPFIFIGIMTGIWLVKRIRDKAYRRFVILMTAIAAIPLMLS